ncbi:MAG: peptidylprolyl isomerase [Lachnospiraceae bacterium]|nr:peptidylprolyl isomerase [Lachnospiraceae bacterium]
MKKFLGILLTMVLVLGTLTACGSAGNDKSDTSSKADTSSSAEVSSSSETDSSEAEDSKQSEEKLLTGKHHAEIVVKDYGTIKLELDADTAPISVTNFVKLAKEGFYDGLTFHRIISGFMIQGGDPNGDGTGGSEETIKGEFKDNGVENDISHVRGVISMARSMENDSASSQFFIVHKDSTFLDGQYAGFGKVTDGMEVVDKICKKVKVEDEDGTTLPENQPVIETIKVID